MHTIPAFMAVDRTETNAFNVIPNGHSGTGFPSKLYSTTIMATRKPTAIRQLRISKFQPEPKKFD